MGFSRVRRSKYVNIWIFAFQAPPQFQRNTSIGWQSLGLFAQEGADIFAMIGGHRFPRGRHNQFRDEKGRFLLQLYTTSLAFFSSDDCSHKILISSQSMKQLFGVFGLTEHCPIFHFPPSVRLSVTGVTSQLFLIILWFRPQNHIFSEGIFSRLIILATLTTWTTRTTWTTWITLTN